MINCSGDSLKPFSGGWGDWICAKRSRQADFVQNRAENSQFLHRPQTYVHVQYWYLQTRLQNKQKIRTLCAEKKTNFFLPFYKIHCTFVLTYKINKFLYFCFVQNYIVLIQKIMRNFFSLVVSHLLNAFCFCLLKIWHF